MIKNKVIKEAPKMNKKRYAFLIISVLMAAFLFVIFCTKLTYHGIYSDMFDYKNLEDSDIAERLSITDSAYSMSFSPGKELTGLFLYIESTNASGNVIVKTFGADGKAMENFSLDAAQANEGNVFVFQTREAYTAQNSYSINIDATSCEGEVNLLLVNDGIYTEENCDSSLYIGYGYKNPVFRFEEQIGWLVFISAIWLLLLSLLWLENDRPKMIARNASIVMLVFFILSMNYTFNSFDDENHENFVSPYDPSDVLALSPMYEVDRIEEFEGFGLGLVDESGAIEPYRSQYGLQGKVFIAIAKVLGNGERSIKLAKLLCSYLAAAVFTGIIYFSRKKFGLLFAFCFGITVLLSPWVVNFAHSLYWVEFKWFLPMLVGLICSIYIDNKKVRRLCYVGAFVSLLINSLCGYEYITTVMMGLIAVPLIDFLTAASQKNKDKAIMLFKTIVILGIGAVLGFVIANLIHAGVKAPGNIIAGLSEIWGKDAVKRTSGLNMETFTINRLNEVNASVWEIVKRYFHFDTDIIAGVEANTFPTLCLLPIVIFIYDAYKKKLNVTHLFMYIVFGITGLSWIVLVKNHSFIHTYLNFVLWYFGFIQTCFFVIASKCIGIVKEKE